MKTMIFALRCIIPGAISTVWGVGMLFSPDLSDVAWRLVVAGPLLVVVGVFILIRNRHQPTEPEDDSKSRAASDPSQDDGTT